MWAFRAFSANNWSSHRNHKTKSSFKLNLFFDESLCKIYVVVLRFIWTVNKRDCWSGFVQKHFLILVFILAFHKAPNNVYETKRLQNAECWTTRLVMLCRNVSSSRILFHFCFHTCTVEHNLVTCRRVKAGTECNGRLDIKVFSCLAIHSWCVVIKILSCRRPARTSLEHNPPTFTHTEAEACSNIMCCHSRSPHRCDKKCSCFVWELTHIQLTSEWWLKSKHK